MSLPDEPSRPSGYSLAHLIVAAFLGAGLMVVLYASGAMSAVSKVGSIILPGGGSEIVSLDTIKFEERERVRGVAAQIAATMKKPAWQVTIEELQKDPKIKEMGLEGPQGQMTLQAALAAPDPNDEPPPKLEGYKPVDFGDRSSRVYNYSILKQPDFSPSNATVAEPSVVTFGEEYGGKRFAVFHLEVTKKASKGPDGKQIPGGQSQDVYFGPLEENELTKQIEQVKNQVDVKKANIEGTSLTSVGARFYANADGHLALVIEGAVPHPDRVVNRGPISFFNVSVEELKSYVKARKLDASKPVPPSQQAVIAVLRKS